MSNTKIYMMWKNMKKRCYNPKCDRYKNYGGRGVKICNCWLKDFKYFYNWAMKNGYKEGLSIDRIDVNGNYEPRNCRFISMEEQYLNRTDNHNITYKGKTQTMKKWSDELGINYDTLRHRLNNYGWTIEKAFIKRVVEDGKTNI